MFSSGNLLILLFAGIVIVWFLTKMERRSNRTHVSKNTINAGRFVSVNYLLEWEDQDCATTILYKVKMSNSPHPRFGPLTVEEVCRRITAGEWVDEITLALDLETQMFRWVYIENGFVQRVAKEQIEVC